MNDTETVSFRFAFMTAKECNLAEEFLDDYGEQSWVDPETGGTIGVDVGELIAWIEESWCKLCG